MGRPQSGLSQSRLLRALKAARAAGFDEVRLSPTGDLRFVRAEMAKPSETPADILDEISRVMGNG